MIPQPVERLFPGLVQEFRVLVDLTTDNGSERRPAVIFRPSPRLLTIRPQVTPIVLVIL
jgi:hypothetical protein